MNSKLLDRVNSPSDIKDMSYDQLNLLSSEIREYICKNVLENGGHLASNLGTVELTLALHRVFDFEKDKLIFDVGHQSYTHKILTGRKDRFSTLRQRGGLSGFTKRSESSYDCFGAGHSSTSVSAAIGFAESERLKGSDAYTVALLGDGAFTGGMIHEALNNCEKELRLVIVLNENEMSISKNIGAFATLIARLRASKGYYLTKRRTANFIKRIPFVGTALHALIRDLKQRIKNRMYKSNYFEDLGLYYLGPIDGHDTERLERLLTEAKSSNQSTVVHVRTVKGKGYAPAEENPGKYHGVSPRSSEEFENFSKRAGIILSELGSDNDKICAVTAAMAQGTGMSRFAEVLPERFFDVGIAEEHALTFCAGLAADGFKPYFAVYSSFLQRGYDNLIHDIALQNLPVTVLVDRAGISKGDGATHHGIFDVAFLSQIPRFEIFTPSDFSSLRDAIVYSVDAEGPVAIRYPNNKENDTSSFVYGNKIARSDFNCKAKKVIITYGSAVNVAMNVKRELGNDVGIILLEKLAPYADTARSINALLSEDTERVVFLEEGIKNGGAGMILRDMLDIAPQCKYTHIAIDGIFEPLSIGEDIYDDYGIGKQSVINAMK